MSLVTKPAPDFKATAVMGDNSFEEISLSQYRGKYTILFFYPLDFTFVCPTEIIAFDKHLEEFEKLDCQVLGVSIDSQFSHWAWKNTPVDHGGIGAIRYPLVADITKRISRDYGVLLEDAGVALRGLFLIDKEGIVRHQVINDLGLGRSVEEALRVLKALQHLETYGEVCPADWHEGDEAMKPTAEGVAHYLAEHAS
ncbi:MAG: peroxiredoxin [Acidobacteria bacterium]|nr:peroxiredoxin [Acidobacteriota bacterium]